MYSQVGIKTITSYEELRKRKAGSKAAYFSRPEDYRLAPFHIFGNLYYVGDRKACQHLVDTGDGLILFDTGYGHEAHLLMDNIRTLGFRVEDIRIIVHSHGHYDHFGCTNAIKAVCGADVYMSRVDTQLLRQMPERSLIHGGPRPDDSIPWPDIELDDGDHIRLGNVDITCRLSPGHTDGTMSFFFDVTDSKDTYRVGYLGGIGYNGMYRQHNERYQLPQDKFLAMLNTTKKLWDEPVDITLGNHPAQNCTVEKRAWMLEHPGENPFIDKGCWQVQLKCLAENCQKAIELGY